ncbi:MAG: alpha/beta fold hydrolase [Leptolyngbya sp.]|nr:alpha/beta fold hydrolase [Candidatus Melainabacteria bacterium]
MSISMRKQSASLLAILSGKFLRFSLLSLILCASASVPTLAQVTREDDANLVHHVGLPVYEWKSTTEEPKAVAVLVHGLTMHGAVYDSLARHLADQGYIVLAPDLHGYGRWTKLNHQQSKCEDCGAGVCYQKTRRDLVSLVDSVKDTYPNLPLYMVGESLGADMVMYTAGQRPKVIEGIVLSSPAIKRRLNLVPRVYRDVCLIANNPFRQINLIPYMKLFASEDPRIIDEAVNDRLVRKKLTPWDLLKTIHTLRPSLSYAEKIPKSMPVLIIQGDKDRMLNCNAVVSLVKHLRTEDRTVKWFANRGHLLLETAYLQDDTLNVIDGWLKNHLKDTTMVQASVHGTIQASNSTNTVGALNN